MRLGLPRLPANQEKQGSITWTIAVLGVLLATAFLALCIVAGRLEKAQAAYVPVSLAGPRPTPLPAVVSPETPVRVGRYFVFENRTVARLRGKVFPKFPIAGETWIKDTTLYTWNGKHWAIVLTRVGVVNDEIVVGRRENE